MSRIKQKKKKKENEEKKKKQIKTKAPHKYENYFEIHTYVHTTTQTKQQLSY